MSSSEAYASRNYFFVSSLMSICLSTEVKWQWAMLVLGTTAVSELLLSLMVLQLVLVDRNPFWRCFVLSYIKGYLQWQIPHTRTTFHIFTLC